MYEQIAVSVVPSLAGGAVLGFLLRKGVKLLAGIAGLFLASLALLEGLGYLKVNWDKMASDLSAFFQALLQKIASLDAAGFASQGAPLFGLLGGALIGWWLAGKA